MSLDYNFSAIEAFKTDRESIVGDDAWPITQAIVFSTMAVGIGNLNAANLPEFWARLSTYESLVGTFLRAFPTIEKSDGTVEDVDGPSVPRPITFDELKLRVGLTTNVFPMETRAKWLKRVISSHLDDVVRGAKRA